VHVSCELERYIQTSMIQRRHLPGFAQHQKPSPHSIRVMPQVSFGTTASRFWGSKCWQTRQRLEWLTKPLKTGRPDNGNAPKEPILQFCTPPVTVSSASSFSYENEPPAWRPSQVLEIAITVFTVKSCYPSQFRTIDFERGHSWYLGLRTFGWSKKP
jgi:hypothetical protein